MTSVDATTYELARIGEVRSEGGRFGVHVGEPYRQGLAGLGEFSHVVVTWWAHEAEPMDGSGSMIVSDTPYVAGPDEAGVFSTRSPRRPNRLGLSICAIADVDPEVGVVAVSWIDALHGTPVVDLKPYFPASDRVRDVVMPAWCASWPSCLEESADFDWSTVMAGS